MPPPEASRLRVALDATPLLGILTGVGAFCSGALGALAEHVELEVNAFAVSWRRRKRVLSSLPAGVSATQRPMPARPLHAAWRAASAPPIEWFTGEVDVVHGTNFVVPPTKRAGRVVTVHDLTTLRFPELCDGSTQHYPELVRRAVAEGAWVHTPSSYVAAEVVECFGADPRRVRAVHHGVPRTVTGDSRPPGLPAAVHRYVLALGTIEPRKDVPTLVRAFDALAARHPDLYLVVAGPDGWGVEAFEAEVERAKAADRVVRLGFVTDAGREWLMRNAEVFAYPSIYEGFGLPPLEAMAAGTPVVATDAGALGEILGDGAELVPPSDAEALATALVRALEDASVRTAMIGRGRATVGRYSWEACGDGLSRLYRDVAAEAGTVR